MLCFQCLKSGPLAASTRTILRDAPKLNRTKLTITQPRLLHTIATLQPTPRDSCLLNPQQSPDYLPIPPYTHNSALHITIGHTHEGNNDTISLRLIHSIYQIILRLSIPAGKARHLQPKLADPEAATRVFGAVEDEVGEEGAGKTEG
ncbi:hypothetical protein KEM55_008306 [Ascosphaera atra]|nr:hypothetical protein KEM55_008306 [Ascosphaera atra]